MTTPSNDRLNELAEKWHVRHDLRADFLTSESWTETLLEALTELRDEMEKEHQRAITRLLKQIDELNEAAIDDII